MKKNKITIASWLLAILTFAGLSIFLYGISMNIPFSHDESVYCTAGALTAAGHVMYRDFAFFHMPWLPVLYGLLFKLTGTINYLWWGRLFSVLCSIGTMALIFEACRRNINGPLHEVLFWGIGASLLYAVNPAVLTAGGLAWNYSLPMLCLMGAFVLLADAMKEGKLRSPTTFFVGILISLAAFTRLNFAPAAATLGIATMAFAPNLWKVRLKSTLPSLTVGVCLPALLPLYFFVIAPDAFLLDTFWYFIITGSHQWMPGWSAAITLSEKWNLFLKVIGAPFFLPCLVALGWGLILLVKNGVSSNRRGKLLLISGMLFTVLLVTGFAITPMFGHYLAPSVPFIIVTTVYLLSGKPLSSTTGTGHYRNLGLVTVCLTCCAILFIIGIQATFVKENWVTTKIDHVSRHIEYINRPGGLMLTLTPVLALQAKALIYPELSTAPFLYRYGHLFTKQQKETMRGADPLTLQNLLRTRPPTAVLVGFESSFLERPLEDFATQADWEKTVIPGEFRLILYRPRTSASGVTGR